MGILNSVKKVSNGLNSAYKQAGSVMSSVKSAEREFEKITGKDLSLNLNDVGSKLYRTKSSIDTISRTLERVDDVLDGGADDFLRRTGIGGRISEAELIANRLASTIDGKKYNTSVIPKNKIDSASSKNKGLQYPPDIGEYYMEFVFMKYERPNPYKAAEVKNAANIYLPVPANLVESHTLNWAEQDQGMFGNILSAAQVDGTQTSAGSAAYAMTDSFLSSFAGMKTSSSALLGLTAAASAAISQKLDIIQQALGAIPNPNISLLFQGPTLRSFPFTWRFHPESPEESNLIKEIISEFRKRILPNTRGDFGVAVLGYPNMLTVKLHPDDHLYKMKRCVVTNMTINYAPNGVPSFFKGTKAPTMIEFTVNLKEIEYFLAEDFGGENDPDLVDFEAINRTLGTNIATEEETK